MAKYLLIESRDPFDSNDVANYYGLAADLARDGNQVTLFLVQNGVLPARPSKHSESLTAVAEAGVEILADDFSLRERGIDAAKLTASVKAAPLDTIVDQLTEGRKALWH
ncbi:MAG: DsrE family protein [Candidatus Binatia bacterium]